MHAITSRTSRTSKPHAEDSPKFFAPAGRSPPREPGLSTENCPTEKQKTRERPKAVSAEGLERREKGRGRHEFWDQSENKIGQPLPRQAGTGDHASTTEAEMLRDPGPDNRPEGKRD